MKSTGWGCLVGGLSILAFAGCALGPEFHEPAAPNTDSYTASPLPQQTVASAGPAGKAQRFVKGQEIPGEWWTAFGSDALNQLIRQALAANPTLDAAEATLRQAQENLTAGVGALSPHINANGSVTRERFSPAGFGSTGPGNVFNLYNASIGVSYSFDVAGGWHREIEALRSQVDYQSFLVEAAHLALVSNVVTTAVKEASLRAQIEATQNILTAQDSQLGVIERRFNLGGVGRTDVLGQRTQVAQTKALLPPLQKQLSQTRHQLAVLTGKLPSDHDLPEFTLDRLELPADLPVSLPSALVRQRPDLRASEALMHQASAEIGVATAALYPQITLTGNYGSQALQVGNLFSKGTNTWNLGAAILQPLFDHGELNAKRRAAIAAYDQAAAQYRETLLQAFQNVADALRALEIDAATLKAQTDADTAARDSLELTDKQFQLGAVSYLIVLNAQRQYQQARIELVQAQAARYADTAALYQALGGGWWNSTAQVDTATKSN